MVESLGLEHVVDAVSHAPALLSVGDSLLVLSEPRDLAEPLQLPAGIRYRTRVREPGLAGPLGGSVLEYPRLGGLQDVDVAAVVFEQRLRRLNVATYAKFEFAKNLTDCLGVYIGKAVNIGDSIGEAFFDIPFPVTRISSADCGKKRLR